MRRVGLVLVGVILSISWATGATPWAIGALSAYSLLENVNALVQEANAVSAAELAPLNVSFGVRAQGGVDPDGPFPPLYGAAFMMSATSSARDISAAVGLVGGSLGVEVARDPWIAYAGVCVGRGRFDLPAVRMVDLSGWAVGAELGGGYVLELGPHLGLSFRIGAQWLPVQEMSNALGQTYRGRGMAFVDFTGLVASMSVVWSP